MTMLSQYLRAERYDPTEPPSFYAPGATGWDDPNIPALRSRLVRGLDVTNDLVRELDVTNDFELEDAEEL